MKILRIALKASLLVFLAVLMMGGWATAQDTVYPFPGNSSSEPATITHLPVPAPPGSNSTSSTTQVVSPVTTKPPTWFDWLFDQQSPFHFGFHADEAYSDNIYYQPAKTYDYITDLSPSLTFTLGKPISLEQKLDEETIDNETDTGSNSYLHVIYRPTLTLYEENPKLDVVDEYADAIYTHQFAKLTLSLEQKYEKLSQPTVQVNAQGVLIHRDIFTTTARANYIYSDQLSTYGTLTQTATHYLSEQYTDNTEWVADYYFLYQLFPKLKLGAGPRIGFEDIQPGPNQDYQAGLMHLFFAATSKVNLSAAFGAEVREYQQDASPTEVTPIFEAEASYQPFDSMLIHLDATRDRIVSTGLDGGDYTATVVALGVRQRFFQKIYLDASGGYENDDYALTGGALPRTDKLFFGSAGLKWESFRGITLGADYEYIRDDSSIAIDRFIQNRFTVSATVKY